MITIAEDLKPFTEEAMKIESAPCMKACTEVDMEELYAELTLERLTNPAKGTKDIPIRNYEEMFAEISSNDQGENSAGASSVKRKKVEGNTIIFTVRKVVAAR